MKRDRKMGLWLLCLLALVLIVSDYSARSLGGRGRVDAWGIGEIIIGSSVVLWAMVRTRSQGAIMCFLGGCIAGMAADQLAMNAPSRLALLLYVTAAVLVFVSGILFVLAGVARVRAR
jgi:hypothetical protein